MPRHYQDRTGVKFDRSQPGVTMVRGGRCWVKITCHRKGRGRLPGCYSVAFGWAGEFQAIPGRTYTVGTQRHAEISALGWVNDYGF